MGMHFKKTALFSLSAAALMGAGAANAAQVPDIDPGFSMTAPTQSDLISPLPEGAEKLEPQIEGQTISGELHSVKEDGKLSVTFAKDRTLAVNDGCNTYTTTYEVAKDGTISVGEFNSTRLDGCRTEGLVPPKTHWARPITEAPFIGYPLRPGITFTYLGVKVDENARVLMDDGRPSANLFASGEIMAGSILGKGYLAGFGMAIGSVFGRIAG